MTLQVNNISRCINRNWIIKDMSFEVSNGECLALLGPSGCGKSTTLRLIAGLDSPNQGSIFIDNTDITNISPVDRNIGMVFQSYALFPHLNVLENLKLGLKVRGNKQTEIEERVNRILSIMQMSHLVKRRPNELSGGQKQRLALARAMLRQPNVYLLDEPMSNLDAQLREELRPELRDFIISGSKPVVYVTHDQQEAMSMSNKIAVMNEGEIQQIGTAKDLYNRPNSLFVASFIGRPQINTLSIKNNVITAIRPEHIYFNSEGLDCKLSHIEWLGNYQLLFIESKYGLIKMMCSAEQERPEKIKISWNKEREHDFDKKTGKRLNNI